MPIYEYFCKKCKKQFEMLHMSDQELALCPNCKGPVKKLPTSGSFRFGDQQRHPNHPDNVAEATQERTKRRRKIK